MAAKRNHTAAITLIGLLGLASGAAAQTATNAFNVGQATGANYVKTAGPVACGAGRCTTTLNPQTVTDLGAMTPAKVAGLIADLAAQRNQYALANGAAGLGAPLDIDFKITQYRALQDGTNAGGVLVVDYTNPRNTVLPANLHWIQIVTDNYNITGVNGNNLTAPTGIGNDENVIDAPKTPGSPFYDVSSNTAPDAFNTNPPHFEDQSQRPDPTAANPTINWNATLFLVSDNNKALTVYDAVQWGWTATYAAGAPEPEAWFSLLVGFGLMGGVMRGRRVLARVAA